MALNSFKNNQELYWPQMQQIDMDLKKLFDEQDWLNLVGLKS